MSQENVEMAERMWDAFNRHDLGTLEALSHEDFEFAASLTAQVDAEAGTYRGADAWRAYFENTDEMWSEWRAEDLRTFDAGDDGVAALCHLIGTGRLSGVPVKRAIGITFKFHQGKVWRLRSYLSHAEALEAVGLSE
jgi:ketosteroid isomerase-like protein